MREVLWSAEEAAAATGGRATHAFAATGVSIDSRTLAPGDLFVALEGETHDGHTFLTHARDKGAAGAMVRRAPDGLDDFPLLIVDDTLAGLVALGRAARARSGARIAAVTGSVGKTGSKEALARVLATAGPTHASAGSYNNHFGVPLSLALLPPSAQFAVFEIGMNHAGEIGPLARLVRPHVALVTTIESVHLEFFASVEAIADAKAEIFEGLEPGGTAVLNRDNPHFDRLAQAARTHGAQVIGFGEADGADARAIRAHVEPDGSRVAAEILGQPVAYRIGLAGRHWVRNSLGVLAAAATLGADLSRAATVLGTLSPLKGRGVRLTVPVRGGDILLIDDSYNASPPSMHAALATLAAIPAEAGRRIAVLGDMLELGTRGPALHRALAADIAQCGIDLVFAAGPNMAHLWDALPAERRGYHADNSADLAPHVAAAVRPGDTLLVKGSFGSRMGVVIDALLAHGGRNGAVGG